MSDEEYSSKNLEIGERITLKDGTILECKEVDDCKDCYFKGKKDCMKEVVGTCAYLSRRDNTSVYFQKVYGEQGGEQGGKVNGYKAMEKLYIIEAIENEIKGTKLLVEAFADNKSVDVGIFIEKIADLESALKKTIDL